MEDSMSGPPPTPAYLRLIRGNPSKRPIRREPEPQIPEALPEPPEFLSAEAKDEWRRIIGEMVRLRLVTPLDIQPFAAYCQSFGHWKTAEETLAKIAERDPVTKGLLIKDRDGDARVNPLLRVVRHAAEAMLQHAAQFGLTPIARARIAAAGFDPPPRGGKFDGLIGYE